MKPAGNHEMDHEPEIVGRAEANALAHAANACDHLLFGIGKGRIKCPQEKRIENAGFEQRLADCSPSDCFAIDSDIGQFGHGFTFESAKKTRYGTR